MYEIISNDDEINWNKIHIFWGDECYIPNSSKYSNYRMAYNSLLSLINIPRENIHPIDTNISPPEKSAKYCGRELKAFLFENFNKIESVFDLIILGIRKDGHIASLFPSRYNIERD